MSLDLPKPVVNSNNGAELVFVGAIEPDGVAPPGFSNLPFEALYDPYSRWRTADRRYAKQAGFLYTMTVVLARIDAPVQPFVEYHINQDTITPLPNLTGAAFYYTAQGFAYGDRPERQDSMLLRVRMNNGSGAPFTFRAGTRYVNRKLWSFTITRTPYTGP